MRQAVVVVVGVVLATAAAIAVLAPGRGSDEASTTSTTSTTLTEAQAADRDRARQWSREMAEALDPLNDTIPALVRDTRSWAEGTLDDELLRGRLGEWQATIAVVADAVGRVGPLRGAPLALPGHRLSLLLYEVATDALLAATEVPTGDRREQVNLIAQRTRILADRVFDRGQATVEVFLREADDPSIDVRQPEEVPSWPAEELAAGPPLAAPLPPPDERFPTRAETRPTQPRERWLAAVAATEVPTLGEIGGALEAADAGELGRLADRLLAAAEALRDVPDPEGEGGREESARLRLGLLVRAEGARTAQASIVLAGTAPAAAERLEAVGTHLLDASTAKLLDPTGMP